MSIFTEGGRITSTVPVLDSEEFSLEDFSWSFNLYFLITFQADIWYLHVI